MHRNCYTKKVSGILWYDEWEEVGRRGSNKVNNKLRAMLLLFVGGKLAITSLTVSTSPPLAS